VLINKPKIIHECKHKTIEVSEMTEVAAQIVNIWKTVGGGTCENR